MAMNARSERELKRRSGERGFTLIETTIGLVIMLVVVLGSAALFSYAVRNNNGGNDRAQALAIAQTALETLRNARYTVGITDPILLQTPATPAPLTVTREGRPYTVVAKIVDEPACNLEDHHRHGYAAEVRLILVSTARHHRHATREIRSALKTRPHETAMNGEHDERS
jgi:prepilin-type N-terminal cleavage/methylation domain-containing protein